ncbi:MAG: EFR1 family ferrodoxin [Actinobacteria bacterium]|nr:EFR1 family ferrodoxin [Actinomycetota bacterium]
MKTLVLFESTTGNTAFGAEIIQATVERLGHECEVKRYKQTRPGDIDGFDMYCFATPINAFGPLAPVLTFLHELPRMDGKPAFIFSTCAGWPGQAHAMMARELQKKGFFMLGDYFMPCTDSFPFTRVLEKALYDRIRFPLKSSMRKLVKFVETTASKAERYLQGDAVDTPKYRVLPTPLFFPGVFASKGMLSMGVVGRSVDMEKCDLCGICAENCPASAISIQNEPRFSSACIGCWGCFNICPRDAVVSRFIGPEYYYKGIRDKERLLQKAGIG